MKHLIYFVTLVLLISGRASGAVVFDAATSVDVDVVFDSHFNHTASGTDRLAIMCVAQAGDPGITVDTHDYGGIPMNLFGSIAPEGNLALSMYQLVNPPTGPQPIDVVWSAFINDGVVGVATFTGVHQTTPLGSFTSNVQNSPGPATVTVPSAVGEVVVDCLYVNDTISISVVSPQSVLWEQDIGDLPGGSSSKAGAAPNVTMSWNLTGNTDWKIGAGSIKPSAVTVGRRRIMNVYP
jgi:hypothetical protein